MIPSSVSVLYVLLLTFLGQHGYSQTSASIKNQECGLAEAGISSTLGFKSALLGRFPWHANLYKKDENVWRYICAGNLITESIVLTAAHCVEYAEGGDFKVAFAKFDHAWDKDEPQTVKRDVLATKVPSNFSIHSTALQWNMALLQLSESVEFRRYQLMPVCLTTPNNTVNNNNTDAYVVSRNELKESTHIERKLVTIVPKALCLKNKTRLDGLLTAKICVQQNDIQKMPVFKGDSGGGLTKVVNGRHHLLGLVSQKYDDVALFTDLTWPPYAQWLNKEIDGFLSDAQDFYKIGSKR